LTLKGPITLSIRKVVSLLSLLLNSANIVQTCS
jgi:hypothetical protein